MSDMRLPDDEVIKACAIGFLEDARRARGTCEGAAEDVQRLEALATLGAVKYRLTPGSPNVDTDKMEGIVAKLEERRQELLCTVGEYLDTYMAARVLCRPGDTARWACWLHHVEGLTWRQVGARVHYSEDWTRRALARTGYEELYVLMPERFRRIFPNAEDWEDCR